MALLLTPKKRAREQGKKMGEHPGACKPTSRQGAQMGAAQAKIPRKAVNCSQQRRPACSPSIDMPSYTCMHTCKSMASILPCSCFLVNSPSASRNLQFKNSGLQFQLFLVSNSRCESKGPSFARLELPDISNCYLGALFSPNHIEEAELCEVEGSRSRAGGERHLLSRVMLCVPRASAARDQKPSGWARAAVLVL